MTAQASDPYATARRQAKDAFADHEMTVLYEDGVYRHLRFQRPGTWMYGFDIVTWPGHLYVGGDIECFTFARLHDMTRFFSAASEPHDINPHYWAEKITSRSERDGTRVYSEDSFRNRVAYEFDQLAENGYEPDEEKAIRAAWADHIFCRELHYETAAHEALRDFGPVEVGPYRGFRFGDSWEWDLRDWDHHFLLTCFALVRGLGMYRDHREAEAA